MESEKCWIFPVRATGPGSCIIMSNGSMTKLDSTGEKVKDVRSKTVLSCHFDWRLENS